MIYIVYTYYSKLRGSDVEQFEVPYNYTYGKGMNARKKPLLPVPLPKRSRLTSHIQ